jgi:hypothetical protein
MTTALSHAAICDWSCCRTAWPKAKAAYATAYFNAEGALWAICSVHRTRGNWRLVASKKIEVPCSNTQNLKGFIG